MKYTTLTIRKGFAQEIKELQKEMGVTSMQGVIQNLMKSYRVNRKNFAKRNNELEQVMQTIALAVSKLNIKIDKLKND